MHLGMTGEGVAPPSPMPSPESRIKCLSTSPEGRGKRSAFSLVELSIVLVILGLLVGGVLTGQSLIRAAELRAVGTEYSKYSTAHQTFRDKYFAMPGDMANATAFWGRDTSNCNGHTGAAGTPGTCNGNGNGIWENGAVSATGEKFQYWSHLTLAGLIEGTYTGLASSTHVNGCNSSNCPKSRLGNAVWGNAYTDNSTGANGNIFAINYIPYYLVGQITTTFNSGSILKPEEAWNIDTKLDDGMPARGSIHSHGVPNTACTTATGNTDFAASYLLSASAVTCNLLLKAY